jgi:ferredoxin
MPGNHIANYKIDSQDEQFQKFDAWQKLIPSVVETVNMKKHYWGIKPTLIDRCFRTGFLYNIASKQFARLDSNFSVSEKCNGCKTCLRICPADNIEIADNKPRWKHQCEQCLACLHWCPQEAIEYGKNTAGRKKYRHPEIKIKDMLIK